MISVDLNGIREKVGEEFNLQLFIDMNTRDLDSSYIEDITRTYCKCLYKLEHHGKKPRKINHLYKFPIEYQVKIEKIFKRFENSNFKYFYDNEQNCLIFNKNLIEVKIFKIEYDSYLRIDYEISSIFLFDKYTNVSDMDIVFKMSDIIDKILNEINPAFLKLGYNIIYNHDNTCVIYTHKIHPEFRINIILNNYEPEYIFIMIYGSKLTDSRKVNINLKDIDLELSKLILFKNPNNYKAKSNLLDDIDRIKYYIGAGKNENVLLNNIDKNLQDQLNDYLNYIRNHGFIIIYDKSIHGYICGREGYYYILISNISINKKNNKFPSIDAFVKFYHYDQYSGPRKIMPLNESMEYLKLAFGE